MMNVNPDRPLSNLSTLLDTAKAAEKRASDLLVSLIDMPVSVHDVFVAAADLAVARGRVDAIMSVLDDAKNDRWICASLKAPGDSGSAGFEHFARGWYEGHAASRVALSLGGYRNVEVLV